MGDRGQCYLLLQELTFFLQKHPRYLSFSYSRYNGAIREGEVRLDILRTNETMVEVPFPRDFKVERIFAAEEGPFMRK